MTDGREPAPQQIVIGYPRRLTVGHGFPSARIIDLIKSSLDPIRGDPVPTSILIHNIVLNQTSADNIEITCEVLYVC